MKSFVVALVIAVTMVGGSIFYSHSLEDRSKSLRGQCYEIENALKDCDFTSAKENIKKLEDNVESFEDFFLATGNHIEIDNIKINLSELRSFTEQEMQGDALAKTYVLEFLFEHLPETMKVRIGNIL